MKHDYKRGVSRPGVRMASAATLHHNSGKREGNIISIIIIIILTTIITNTIIIITIILTIISTACALACVLRCVTVCLRDWSPACVRACVFACSVSCLPDCLRACTVFLHDCMCARVLACWSVCTNTGVCLALYGICSMEHLLVTVPN